MARVTNIQVRRGLSSEWTTQVLSDGEIGFETNTGKFKIGSGGVAWNLLEYATDTSNFAGVLSSANGGTGVNNGTSTLALSGSTAIGSSNHTVNIATTANTSITLPTSGTLLSDATPVTPAQGGNGSFIYGAAVVGRASLAIDHTRTTVTGVEPVFYDASTNATAQYINLKPDTVYSFDGYVQMVKDGSNVLPSAAIQYYSTGTNALTPQSFSCQIVTRVNTAVIGLINLTTVNTTATSNGSSNTAANFSYQIAGTIRTAVANTGTNPTGTHRFTLACGASGTLGAVGSFRAGSYLNIVEIGSGNVFNFGNWTN
jgi:hypothetical protein